MISSCLPHAGLAGFFRKDKANPFLAESPNSAWDCNHCMLFGDYGMPELVAFLELPGIRRFLPEADQILAETDLGKNIKAYQPLVSGVLKGQPDRIPGKIAEVKFVYNMFL